jgi:hypothetical protein
VERFIHLWLKFTGGIEIPLEAHRIASFLSELGPPHGLAASTDRRLAVLFLLRLHVPLHWSASADGRVLAVQWIKLFKYVLAAHHGLEIQETANDDEAMMIALRRIRILGPNLTRQVCRDGQSGNADLATKRFGSGSMRSRIIAFLPMFVLKRIRCLLSWAERDPVHTSQPLSHGTLFSAYFAASLIQARFRMRSEADGTAVVDSDHSLQGSLLPHLVDNHQMAVMARRKRQSETVGQCSELCWS